MKDDRELSDRLRALRVDPPDDLFRAALHRKLAAAGEPDQPGLWRKLWPEARMLWPALGVAASLAVFFMVARQKEPAAVLLPATKVAVVRVNLSAQVAVQSAQIKVSLPDGLVFWSDGQELAQRAFEWSQPLNAGDNDIPIAVRGLRPGRYRVTLTARMNGQEVDDDVLLEVPGG